MTRKRLVKLIMGCGYSRNAAQVEADTARRYFSSYATYWDLKAPFFRAAKVAIAIGRSLRNFFRHDEPIITALRGCFKGIEFDFTGAEEFQNDHCI